MRSPETLTGHALARDVDEKRFLIRQRDHLRADEIDIILQRFDRLGIHRDKAFLVAAAASDDAGGEIDVVDVQINKLGNANAGGIQKLKHGLVAVSLGVGALRLFEQQIHFPAGQDLRQLVLTFIGDKLCRRVFRDHLTKAKERIQAFDRSDTPRYGSDRLSVALQPGDIFRQLLFICRRDFLVMVDLEIITKLSDITKIRTEGVGRRLLFICEILCEYIDACAVGHGAPSFPVIVMV